MHALDVVYEIVFPPIAIDAGLGEQGRFGCLTPELGGNFRPAVVTTSLPMEIDRPINAGIRDFCMECGICAEQRPSGAIPFDEPRDNGRGVVKWTIDASACYNYRLTSRGSATCGICITVCPWTRRDNLIHGMAKQALMRDRTGVLAKAAVAGEKALYVDHESVDFYPPKWATSCGDGRRAHRDVRVAAVRLEARRRRVIVRRRRRYNAPQPRAANRSIRLSPNGDNVFASIASELPSRSADQ